MVYADDSRLEIVRINISKDLGKDDTYKLWDALSVIINKPDDVGFRCRLEPGFLQIQSVDLRRLYSNTLESPAPQTEVMDYRPLFQILRLAIINTIEIKVQSDAALDQLIQILSTHGSLKELSICDIADAQLLSRIGGVFKQNPHLRKLSLEAIPRTFPEVLEADSTSGRKVFTHYSSHQVVIDPQLFRHLTELRELTFVNLAFMQVGLINILRQIRSLQEFTYSEPNLDNKVAISIRALADDLGLNIDLGSSSPKRLNGYDNSTRKNVVDKLFYPSTSQELLGKYKGNKEISIK